MPSTCTVAPGGSVTIVTSRVSTSGAASISAAGTAASATTGGGGAGALSLRVTAWLPPVSITTVVTTAAITTATSATQPAILSGLRVRTALRRGPVILARSVDRCGS